MTAPTLVEFLRARIADDWRQVSIADLDDEYFTPARMLAECQAKRRIVDLRVSWQYQVERASGDPTAAVIWESQVTAADVALRALASVYADHADYREEWRP